MFLAQPANELCVHCVREGRRTRAQLVDHRVPHKGHNGLFWDKANWQPSCRQCNTLKGIRSEGAFGRPASDLDTYG
jgi:5-methylcytosine-specific restriction protein A